MLRPSSIYVHRSNRRVSPVWIAWNHELKSHLKSTVTTLITYWMLYTLTGLSILSEILPFFPCCAILFFAIPLWTTLILKDECDVPSHILKQTIRFYQCYIDVASMVFVQIIWVGLVFMGFYQKFTPWFSSESADQITFSHFIMVSLDLFLQSSYLVLFIRTTKHVINQEQKHLPM